MSKLSFTDKISVLLEVSKNTNFLILLIIFLLVLGFVYVTSNKHNQKRTKMTYLVSTIFILVVFITTYHSSLSNMFDYMMNNFFIAVYFPNLAIYMFAILITNIILWVSLFNYKTTKIIKRVNIGVYILMNYLLCLILTVVNDNKLDVFNQTSVYANKNVTALIELSSLLFVVWIIFLVVYKLILIYLRKDYQPKVKRVRVIRKVKKLPENFSPKEIPAYVKGKLTKKETPVEAIKEKPRNDVYVEEFEKMFTLDDYKLLSKMLKEQKLKERMAEQKLKEQMREQEKISELQSLYQSAR